MKNIKKILYILYVVVGIFMIWDALYTVAIGTADVFDYGVIISAIISVGFLLFEMWRKKRKEDE